MILNVPNIFCDKKSQIAVIRNFYTSPSVGLMCTALCPDFHNSLGRIGYGPHPRDFKGIVSKVTLGSSAESQLDNWIMYSMPLNDTKIITKYVKTVLEVQKSSSDMAKLIKEDFEITRGKGMKILEAIGCEFFSS